MLLIQEAALGVGPTSVAIFRVLSAALQGLIGFPLMLIILKREAAQSRLPASLTTTAGTLLVVALILGYTLRTLGYRIPMSLVIGLTSLYGFATVTITP